jgi:hypothetical protein
LNRPTLRERDTGFGRSVVIPTFLSPVAAGIVMRIGPIIAGDFVIFPVAQSAISRWHRTVYRQPPAKKLRPDRPTSEDMLRRFPAPQYGGRLIFLGAEVQPWSGSSLG